MEEKKYTKEIEDLFIQFMFTEPELYARVSSILKPAYFENGINKKVVQFMMEHANKFNVLPTNDQLKAITSKTIEKDEEVVDQHRDWFLEEFEQFCRHKAIEIEVYNAPELLMNQKYHELESRIKAAVEIGLVKDLGTEYFRNIKDRIDSLKNKTSFIPTGWRDLDEKLYGGFERGTLNIFAGQSGFGKSLFLQNLAINYAQQGLSVAYITYELSEKLTSLRLDAMISSYSTKDVLKYSDDASLKISMFAKNAKGKYPANLQVKQLPNGTNVNDLKSYLKELELKQGRKTDVIIVDYLDLLSPKAKTDMSNLFIKDKLVSEELRSLAVEKDAVLVSASQLNRCLTLDTVVSVKGKGKIEIRDVIKGDEIESNKGFNKILTVFPVTKQEVYRIKTMSGKTITCSEEHIFPTTKGTNKISNSLKVGDVLFIKDDTITKMFNSNVDAVIKDEIVEIVHVGEELTIDIETDGNHLFYANDILTHNSSHEDPEFGHNHIAGGISKINTCDNLFGIYTTPSLREAGRYQLQLMKTRSSAGVGQRIELSFNPMTMKIGDLDKTEVSNIDAESSAIIDKLKRKSNKIPEAKKEEDVMVGINRLKNMINGKKNT